MSKKLACLALSLLLALSFVACGGNTSSTTPESVASGTQSEVSSLSTPEAAVEGNTITNPYGGTVTVPYEVNSIISMAPSTTQLLIEMGVGDAIVAVDNESAWMFGSGLTGEVSVFELTSPDLEQTLLLQPDIIFTSVLSTEGGDDPFDSIAGEGIAIATLGTPSSIEGIFADIEFIAACVGTEDRGEAFISAAQAKIDHIKNLSENVGERKSVLFEISALPYIYSFGDGVYLSEVLEIIGADNVLAGESGWLPVTEEAAVAANPDVILTNVTYIDEPVEEILNRDGWQNVAAVQTGSVYYVDNFSTSLPNNHVADALMEMAKLIYPEVYGEPA